MKQITIRGIPAEVQKAVAKEAKKKKTSLNRAVVSILEKGAGVSSETADRPRYTDLDALAGCWAKEEVAEFDSAVVAQRMIEEDLWKTGR